MTPHHHPDPVPVDMSPDAIDDRIRDLADLWDLWIRLELDRSDGKLSGPGVRTTSELPKPRAVVNGRPPPSPPP